MKTLFIAFIKGMIIACLIIGFGTCATCGACVGLATYRVKTRQLQEQSQTVQVPSTPEIKK